MALDYWYDAQLRQYFLQFQRIFNSFQYAAGTNAQGEPILRTVPCRMALMNRQVGAILKNNSDATILSTPQFTFAVSSLLIDDERRQSPNHESTVQVWEREVVGTQYTGNAGSKFTVSRIMPVPYRLNMQVDLWTSNESQKHQLLEQLLVLFNPSIDLQTSTNPLDWTALTTVKLEEINWSNRSIPIGTEDDIDIATLSFSMPIWITAPAKLKRQNIIDTIIARISDMSDIMNTGCGDDTPMYVDDADLMARVITTPGNHRIMVEGNEIQLLNEQDEPYPWSDLLAKYPGNFRSGISQLRLKTNDNMDDHKSDIVGQLFVGSEPSIMEWSINLNTLPANTLTAVNAIINPSSSSPGVNLPEAATGQRYLILEDIIPSSPRWGHFTQERRISFNSLKENGSLFLIRIK